MLFSSLAILLTFASSIIATPAYGLGRRQATTLNAAMVSKGRSYIGTALTIRGDDIEQDIIKSAEFGSITPENAMKWDATEPKRGVFNWTLADQVADFATQNNKQMRCHTLLWHNQLPAWVNTITNNATMISVIENHIKTVVGRYKGKCTHWDVVNEALNEDGTDQVNIFSKVIGQAYIPIAFRIAAAADPSAKLFYNDYNLEYGGAKQKGALRIVKLIQSWGIKIDGVGIQGHLVSEPTSTQSVVTPSVAVLTKVLQDFADLGVDVAYTEADIRTNTPSTIQKLDDEASAWARVAQSCINVSRCIGITIWGVSDKYSWVNTVFTGEGLPLLWSDSFQKKSAYQSFLDVLNGKNVTSTR